MVVVLVLAAGADWESPALTRLADRADVVVLKRCVDVPDLLATAAAGQAEVAVVAIDSPGLDRAAVDHLRGHGVRPVAVLPSGPDLDAAALRAGGGSSATDLAMVSTGSSPRATRSASASSSWSPTSARTPIRVARSAAASRSGPLGRTATGRTP